MIGENWHKSYKVIYLLIICLKVINSSEIVKTYLILIQIIQTLEHKTIAYNKISCMSLNKPFMKGLWPSL